MTDNRLELVGALQEAARLGRQINALRGHSGHHVDMTGIGSPYSMEAEARGLEKILASEAEREKLVGELAEDLKETYFDMDLGSPNEWWSERARRLLDKGWRKDND